MCTRLTSPLVLVLLLAVLMGCGGSGGGGFLPPPAAPPPPAPALAFQPVGVDLGSALGVSMAFLPGAGGDALVVQQDGVVHYTQGFFMALAASTNLPVQLGGEQGLVAVVADPAYASNGYVYLYRTPPGGGTNHVLRATVDLTGGTLTLQDQQVIAEFPKSESPAPGTSHNGGAMAFDGAGNLLVGVGDGGGSAGADPGLALAQDLTLRLGKLHRLTPSRTPGVGGFSAPANGVSTTHASIFARGLRNPFTLAVDQGVVYVGDVGAALYEEVDRAAAPGGNFGWPLAEGPVGDPAYVDPLHGYAHADTRFQEEDPTPDPATGGRAIALGPVYRGDAYGPGLDGVLLYTDIYLGWVRALRVDASGQVLRDDHVAHQRGLTCLRVGPDGALYGLALGHSAQVLRARLE